MRHQLTTRVQKPKTNEVTEDSEGGVAGSFQVHVMAHRKVKRYTL